MRPSRQTIPAARFKAECLGLLDQVATSGEVVVITKRGKPVAKLVPAGRPAPRSLRKSVAFHGDIVRPIGDPWDAEL